MINVFSNFVTKTEYILMVFKQKFTIFGQLSVWKSNKNLITKNLKQDVI